MTHHAVDPADLVAPPPRKKKRRFVADALSSANLLCGLLGIHFALLGHPEVMLVLLLVGAACDGLDGAAARRWGGTPWGVWSDDVADAVHYALAPGVALACGLGGLSGLAIGAAFTTCTLWRLAFFTLHTAEADPGSFRGVPSTIGALVALSALLLFPDDPAVVGLLVGVAIVQMVSFDSSYRHLGRALLARRRRVAAALALAVALVVGGAALGPTIPTAALLVAALVYGFLPPLRRFADVARARLKTPSGDVTRRGGRA